MDITLYGGLIYFIKHNREKFPKRIDEETKKEIENQHQNYTLGEDKITLYYENDRRVLREDEFEELLMETHDEGGHYGSSTIYDMVRPKYYWPRMMKHIQCRSLSHGNAAPQRQFCKKKSKFQNTELCLKMQKKTFRVTYIFTCLSHVKLK